MSILSVDNISPIGSGTSVTVNSAATLVLTNANSTGVITATSFVGSGANLTGVLSNIVEDTSPQLGGTLDTNQNNIHFNDNVSVRFGSSQDFDIYHSGTNGIIDNNTGDLYIQTTGSGDDILIESADDFTVKVAGSETAIQATGDGAVELYHNGNRQVFTIDGGMNWQDNKKAEFGNSGDLKIYHDSFNSRIADDGTGYLINTSNGDGILFQHSSGQNLGKFLTGGAVELYHNFSKKFETMSTGARIQGGLLFNSDTAAANTLDDYEEGTWTPDWRGASALGTTSYGSYNAASYVKVGNQVTVRGHSQITGSSGGSGFWFINNLPFLVGGGDDRRYRSVGSVLIENFNFNSDVTDIVCFIERNNNDMQIRSNRDNASGGVNISVNADTSFDIMWTITYPTV